MKLLRYLEIAAILLLAGAGVGLLVTRPLDDRLDVMLPQDPELLRSLRVLEDAKLAGRVIVHVWTERPDVPHAEFVAAMDRLAADLRSPLVTQVVTPQVAVSAPEDVKELAKVAPQLLGPDIYPDLERRLDAEDIGKALAGIRRAMMSPYSTPLSDWFRRDPLGARATALKPLETLGKAMGYRMAISDGHFFSEDQRAAMLILETPVRITDHAASAQLVDHLRACLGRLPAGLRGTIISGHLHTLSNQHILRRDIGWTSLLASIFFGALFLVHYRDLRSVSIFLIPPLGILMGLTVVGLTGARVVAIVLGMCSLLAGIAIDYGIHVYVALTRPETDRSRDEAVRRIHRSLWLSALTTITPFAALMLSSIPGYRQLGLLAGATLLFSLLLAVRVLPLLFPPMLQAAPPVAHRRTTTKPVCSAGWAAGLFGICLAGAGLLAAGVDVNLDFARLDGTDPAILRDEEDFFARWGAGPSSMGILAVWDADSETALQANDAMFRQLNAVTGVSNGLISLAAVWPAEATRRANAARWLEFWDRHADGLRMELNRQGPAYGFATNAFDPFHTGVREGADATVFPVTNRLLKMFVQQFTRTNDDSFMVLSFFPDTPVMTDAMTRLHDLHAPYACVSRRGMQERFAASVMRDLGRQALIGLVLIGLLVTALVREARAILLITIAPIAGVVGMLAGLRLAGQPLSPIGMVAGLLLAGNCFDYGVFMLEAWRRGSREGIDRGIYLAWLTTAGGAALLLVARHPVLFAMGLSLTVGVTCGYVTARWALWPLAQVLRVPTRREGGAV